MKEKQLPIPVATMTKSREKVYVIFEVRLRACCATSPAHHYNGDLDKLRSLHGRSNVKSDNLTPLVLQPMADHAF